MSAVRVIQGTRTPVSVVQGASSASSIVVRRTGDIALTNLTDVDTTQLQDGYILTYDDETKKFKTQQLSVDGGSY
jgi:hypothetical protein